MNNLLSRKSNIVVQELETEVLIYDLTINKAFCLNETSSLVYQLCDGTRTVAEISDEMSLKLKTLVSEDLVYLALDELRKNNLLENSDEVSNHFVGISRREVIKKVGLASMVALPIIASVVAPSAAMAQSELLANFSMCTTSPECLSGYCTSIGMACCNPGVNPPNTGTGLFTVNGLGQVGCNNNFAMSCCSATSAIFTQDPPSPTGFGVCNCFKIAK